MPQQIEIIVSPQGEARLQTIGFSGTSCRDASRFLERALGQSVSEQLTAEFHQQTSTSTSTSQQARS
jgi:hypothetical protein